MSEDDNLPIFTLGGQSLRDGFPVHVIERRNGVIKHDAGAAVGCGHLSQKSSESDTPVLTFA